MRYLSCTVFAAEANTRVFECCYVYSLRTGNSKKLLLKIPLNADGMEKTWKVLTYLKKRVGNIKFKTISSFNRVLLCKNTFFGMSCVFCFKTS